MQRNDLGGLEFGDDALLLFVESCRSRTKDGGVGVTLGNRIHKPIDFSIEFSKLALQPIAFRIHLRRTPLSLFVISADVLGNHLGMTKLSGQTVEYGPFHSLR